MGRAPCCDKANVKKGPWSPEEDAKLKDYIEKHGTGGNWIALPQKIGLKRCGKSCRLRWLNYLRPNIKHGGFTEEEDRIICSLYISIGSRWSIIAAQLPGRTDNDIKNYWNTRLKKKLLGKRKQTLVNRLSLEDQQPKHGVEDQAYSQNLSSSALERLQLHMQLQNTISFYNNPSLWPKLNPLQEKMIGTLQSRDDEQNTSVQQIPISPQTGDFYENISTSDAIEQDYSSNIKAHKLENHIFSNNSMCVGSPSRGNTLQQPSGAVHQNIAEIDELLNNKVNGNFVLPPSAGQMAEFDWSKDIEGGYKDDLLWWTNEFDGSSDQSLNSWNSSSMNYQQGEMYQNPPQGYNMV